MQLKIKNEGRAKRGFWVNGELVYVDPSAQGTFTGATKTEAERIASLTNIKVWADDKPMFDDSIPDKSQPWLVTARDNVGSDMQIFPLPPAHYYVGMAVAGERPDSAGGYKWVKVGGDAEGVSGGEKPEVEAVDGNAPVDYAELVKGNAADVIAKVDKDNAAAIGDAEEKREGGPRKGVMKAVEDAIG